MIFHLRKPVLLRAFLLLAWPWTITAAEQNKAAREYIRFERLSIGEGLSQSHVYDMLQDKMGWMWIATNNGLNRYDGYKFKAFFYDSMNPNSLSSNQVRCLFEDQSGQLWVGTHGGGLNRYDPRTNLFHRFLNQETDPSSLSNNQVTAIEEDSEGRLWVGTHGGGLNLLNSTGDKFLRFGNDPNNPNSLTNDYVRCLLKDRTGVFWVGTLGGGLNRMNDAGRFSAYRADPNDPTRLHDDRILALFEGRDGNLWVGTFRGLSLLDRNTQRFTHFNGASHGLSHTEVRAIYEDDAGDLWVGLNGGGLNRLDKRTGRFKAYGPDPADPFSFSFHEVFSIFEDRSGVMWFGTRGGGINRFNRANSRFRHIRLDHLMDDVISLRVLALEETEEGDLWLGSSNGLMRFDKDLVLEAHYQAQAGGLANNWVTAIVPDRQGDLWLGSSFGGLNKLENPGTPEERFTSYKHEPERPDSLSHDGIVCMAPGANGALWIGTSGAGLDLFDPVSETFTHFTHNPGQNDSLSHDMVSCLFTDNAGVLWVGTFGGLNRYNGHGFNRLVHEAGNPSSLSDSQVFSIHQDRSGHLWVGGNSGLHKMNEDGSTFQHYRPDGAAVGGAVFSVLADDLGYLWMGTDRGLLRFDPRNETFRRFNEQDGLLGEFLFGSRFKSKKGELFFGGINGYNRFFPSQIIDHPFPPSVVITDFLLFNESAPVDGDLLSQPIFETKDLDLSYKDAVFSFEFSAMDYAAPGKNKYAYILEGVDDQWTYTSADKRFATYTHLSPGSYVFRVKGSNHDGVWNNTGASLNLTIQPPIWRTWWAYTFYVLVVLGFVSAYMISHQRKLADERSTNERLDKMVAERTSTLEERNAEILAQQKRLREMDELKTRFFTNISHEFRTPLTLTVGPLDDLLSGDPDERTRSQLMRIRRNTRQLMKLINELLDVSKLEAGQMTLQTRQSNIVSFVRDCVSAFLPLAERKNILLSIGASDENIALYFDPGKLEKVFYNLLSNAFKYTSEQGKILVGFRETPDRLVVSVKDTGVGIPENLLPYVFDRFYQAQNKARDKVASTGIGLSLAKELVALHGGDIEVESEPGFGCEFRVILPKGSGHLSPDQIVDQDPMEEPRSEWSPEVDPEEIPEAAPPNKRGGKSGSVILVVEDNPEVRSYIREQLEGAYQILESENGEAGLKRAQEEIPELVISDVMMPGAVDGFELCRRLKQEEKTSHIPVVLLTAKASTEDNIAGLERGADDYIIKPFDARVLQTRVANLIESRRMLKERYCREMALEPAQIPVNSIEQEFLDKAMSIIEEHLEDGHFGVFELSEEMGFSRRQLHRKMTAITGRTPAEFIRRVRLERASQLLNQRAGNISEVAYKVGFSKPQHFSNLFKETFGMTPSDYLSKTLEKQRAAAEASSA